MVDLSGFTWPAILAFANLILSSAIVITAFSLLGYILTHNFRSRVAQTFSLLLACVLIVFSGDILVPRVASHRAALMWMRFQWIGIAMVPAAYLHFSDALLRSTRHFSSRRRAIMAVSYLVSSTLVFTALFSDALVHDGTSIYPVTHLSPGPLFPFFVAYFLATGVYGAFNVILARKRCLTPASRRRMTYLTLSFAAPGLGVFPYLITSGIDTQLGPILVMLMSMAANVIVGTMLVVMAYSVAYYGVLAPDRVVKHELIHYLLRGPIVGIVVIIVMLVIPRVELVLGLPRDTVLIFAVVGVMVLGQLGVTAAKPWIDRLIYNQDREEITWIQTLDSHLLTSSDLRQFLTNVLTNLCELLRVDAGFVLAATESGLNVEVEIGESGAASRFADSTEAAKAWRRFGDRGEEGESETPTFFADTAYWFCPLRSEDGEKLLGLLAIRARSPEVDLLDAEREESDALLAQAAAVMADRYVQEGVFATLQAILPDLERIQEWRSAVRYAPPSPAQPDSPSEASPIEVSWQQWVKDALSHYWGGPKLSESPLLRLKVVNREVRSSDGNPTRALRSVLQQAIERQRPAGERTMTASEWLLYNILELRFVQGMRVREIAHKLSMSESDLYRKQRAAVAEVAKAIADMEAEANDRDVEVTEF